LLDVAEFLGEVNLTGLLVVAEEADGQHTVLAVVTGASAAVEVGMTRSTRSIAMEP
jgi:hypothetical protein